jgi:hypothetical protein
MEGLSFSILNIHDKILPLQPVMKLALISLITFLLNMPFGYWRDNVKKFSLQWILAIHVAVVLVIIERIFSGIGFAFITYPVMIGSFFLGQYLGGRIHRYFKKTNTCSATSCLVMDLFRCCFGLQK